MTTPREIIVKHKSVDESDWGPYAPQFSRPEAKYGCTTVSVGISHSFKIIISSFLDRGTMTLSGEDRGVCRYLYYSPDQDNAGAKLGRDLRARPRTSSY